MKNIFILLILLTTVSCMSSGDSKEAKKAKPRNEKVGKVEMVKADLDKYYFEVNGEELKEAKVPYGCTVRLVLKGLGDFVVKEGKVQCLVSLKLTDKNNQVILNEEDLFKNEYPAGMPEEMFGNEMSLTAKFQTPFKINETYKFVGTIKDKNSESKVVVTEDFLMIPTPGLTYEEKGLSSDGPLLFNTKDTDRALSNNVLNSGDTLRVYFTGTSGLVQKDSLVWLDASMKLVNEFGDEIMSSPDLYKEYNKTGMPLSAVKELVFLKMYFSDVLKSGKKYSAFFTLTDKKDKTKSLSAKYDFTIK